MNPTPKLLPGDIVLTGGRSWIARAVRFFSTQPDESATWANHAMIVAPNGRLVSMEPVFGKYRDLADFAGDMIAVYRVNRIEKRGGEIVTVTDRDRERLGVAAANYVGCFYGVAKCLLHAVGLRRFCTFDAFPICSWAVAMPYAHILGVNEWPLVDAFTRRFVPAREVTPDDLADFCEHPYGRSQVSLVYSEGVQ